MSTSISQLAFDNASTVMEPVHLAVISSKSNSFAARLLNALGGLQPGWDYRFLDDRTPLPEIEDGPLTSLVYVPSLTQRDGMAPDLGEAKRVLEYAASRQSRQFVILSSALIYGTGPGRQGFVSEEYPVHRNGGNRIPDQWNLLEALAGQHLGRTALTILRPTIVLGSPTLFTRLLSRRFVPALPGHDPTLQLLSLSDLAGALLCAVRANKPGTFNVAPHGVVPMDAAIRLGGSTRTPIPRTLQRVARGAETLDFLRYSWTVSNKKIKEELGFVPAKSSVAALLEFRHRKQDQDSDPQFDEFGMDREYIRFYGKSLFKFLSEYYWRVEDKGLEHIPRQGRGVLVGMHRGFMPWDGVMALHTVVKKTGRYPRFLTHPALLKFPFLANFMTKLGGVVACQDRGDHLLESGELLGIFPEGIHGAFTPYRKAYKLQAFGRDAFVKFALRHRAPIIPFVTVGSAEIFPIFGKIKSHRWTRYAGWPFIPITATFPAVPLPLPSKWHTQFLPPIRVDAYPPEAADERAVVKAISREVRARMQQAIDHMLGRRRSIFFGSIFERRTDETRSKPVAV